jgi:spore coat-associated protein N
MSRLQVLFSQPRLALGALLTLLLAGGAVVGSGAIFSATSATATNTFASGTLSLDNSNKSVAILSANNMRPSSSTTGAVDVENTGSLSGTFTLARSTLTNVGSASPLSEQLNVKVVDCGDFASGTPTCDAGDAVKYAGTLAAMGTSALGDYAAGAKHRYEFTVVLDGTAGNAYQGGTTTVEFKFDATS